MNAQSYASCIFAGSAEAWSVKRLDLLKNIYADQGNSIDNKSGVPNGYNMSAKLLPLKPGGMASFNPSAFSLTGQSASMKAGRNLTGTGNITLVGTAAAELIVSLAGTGSISLTGSAAMTAAVSASGTGSISLTGSAILGGIVPISATGSMSLTGSAAMTALAFMSGTAGGATPLSPEGLAVELLDAQEVETGYSLRESLRLVLAAMAGKVSGGGTSTITIRSVTDGTNRIVATVDSNGNRTSVTHDVGDE